MLAQDGRMSLFDLFRFRALAFERRHLNANPRPAIQSQMRRKIVKRSTAPKPLEQAGFIEHMSKNCLHQRF